MIYHLSKLRRRDPALNAKFTDPSRQFIKAKTPFKNIEIYTEKDAVRSFIARLAMRYRLSIQVLRGFSSLSVYRVAIARAKKNGVRTILYLGDHDPSGVLIEKVAAKEMKIRFVRVAVTFDQIRRLRLRSIPVNKKDSRAKAYVKKFGNKAWEIEAIRPRTLIRLIEKKFKQYIPKEFIEEAKAHDKAVRLAKPVVTLLAKRVEREALALKKKGLEDREIVERLFKRYRFGGKLL